LAYRTLIGGLTTAVQRLIGASKLLTWLGLGPRFRVRVSDYVSELQLTGTEKMPIKVRYADALTSVTWPR